MKKLNRIARGTANNISRSNRAIERIAHKRINICNRCPHKGWAICNICKCVISSKAREPEEVCPVGNW